jgi:flagellar motor switch protein FliG
MVDKNAAMHLLQEVDSICSQLQELAEFSRTLSALDPELAKVVWQKISRTDPELGEFLSRSRYSFQVVLTLNDADIAAVLKRIDKRTLTIALKGCEEVIQCKFFHGMSSRAVELMKEEMAFFGPVKSNDVMKSRMEVVALIRELEEEGVISIGGYPDWLE